MKTSTAPAPIPDVSDLTTAPLRHRFRLQLHASPADVWALVGAHTRLPEYCGGIASVEVEDGGSGARHRVCTFRAPDGAAGPSLRERICWEAPALGYATMAEPGNPFGLERALELVTLAPVSVEGTAGASTLLTWEEHYDNAELETALASFDAGLGDIAQRLVARFGGKVLLRWSDAPLPAEAGGAAL